MKDKYRSELSKAIGSGASGSGAHHWWYQRLTAVILVLMTYWMIKFFWQISANNEAVSIILALQDPFNIVMLIIFAGSTMYHAVLGMAAIIEDYIKCQMYRIVWLVILKLFAIVTIISFFVALIYVIML